MARTKAEARWPDGTFGLRLRELREAAGLSQAALAGAAGAHRNTVVGIENGWSEPTWPLVLRLARALGVCVTAFLPSDTGADPG